MVEGGASQSFMGIARRFSRRGLLGTIGIGAAAGVAIALTRMGISAPPVFASGDCSYTPGLCNECVSSTSSLSPDASCKCYAGCVCSDCSCSLFFVFIICCNNACLGSASYCLDC